MKPLKLGCLIPSRTTGEGCAHQRHVVKGLPAGPATCHAGDDRPRHPRHHDAAHLRSGPHAQAGDQRRRRLVPVGRRTALRRRVFLRLHHGGLPRLGRDHLPAAHDHPRRQLQPRLGPRGYQRHRDRWQQGCHPRDQATHRNDRRPRHLQPGHRRGRHILPDRAHLHRAARRHPRRLHSHPRRHLLLRRHDRHGERQRHDQVRADPPPVENRPRRHPQERRRDLPDHPQVRHHRRRPQRQVQHDERRRHRPAAPVRDLRVLLGLGQHHHEHRGHRPQLLRRRNPHRHLDHRRRQPRVHERRPERHRPLRRHLRR